ncbi:MAG: DMT family transporter [Alphaproteobacteria bacterium]|nr:DMT family transporter [Alphaproteobacteria bacterium]
MAAALLAMVFWGAWFPLSRLSVTESITPEDLAILRVGLPGLLLLPVALRLGFKAGKAGWWGTAAMAGTIGIPFALVLGTGLLHAPAAHAAIFIPGTFPALTALLGILLLRERAGALRLAGVGLTVAGVGLTALSALQDAPPGGLGGYALFHLGAWMWAIYTVTARRAEVSPLHAAAILSTVSTAAFLPLFLLFGESRLLEIPFGSLAWQAFVHGILGGIVSIWLYSYAIGVLGAGRTGVFAGLVPGLGALFSALLLGESLAWPELAGLAVVTAGIVMVQAGR